MKDENPSESFSFGFIPFDTTENVLFVFVFYPFLYLYTSFSCILYTLALSLSKLNY